MASELQSKCNHLKWHPSASNKQWVSYQEGEGSFWAMPLAGGIRANKASPIRGRAAHAEMKDTRRRYPVPTVRTEDCRKGVLVLLGNAMLRESEPLGRLAQDFLEGW